MNTNHDNILKILQEFQAGNQSIESAADDVMKAAGGNLGFARIDHGRFQRCGFPEFIYGEGKNTEQMLGIIAEIRKSGQHVMATRVSAEVASKVLEVYPEAEYDDLARVLIIRSASALKSRGMVTVVTAGTTDLGVAREASHTAEICGCNVELVADAGVAGIQRLLSEAERLQKSDVVIAVAGMEGALPSVVGGLVSCPVIAVPTSVGYGASLGGLTAMLAMLNSCASGITVVNINNGFGAGCAAARIINAKYK